MTKTIISSCKLKAEILVDEEFYPLLSRKNWGIHSGYATCHITSGVNHRIFMHHLILGREGNYVIDHINQNKLDNRLENLRCIPHYVNMINRGPTKKNTSGYKGVSKTVSGKYKALIRRKTDRIYLGTFKTAKEAGIAYNKEAIKFWGKYAWLNPID